MGLVLTLTSIAIAGAITWLLYRPPSDARRMTLTLGVALVALVVTQGGQAIMSEHDRELEQRERAAQAAKVDRIYAVVVSSDDLSAGKLAEAINPRKTVSAGSDSKAGASVAPTILLLDGTGSMRTQPVQQALRSYLGANPPPSLVGLLTFGERGATALPLGEYSTDQLLSQVKRMRFDGQFTDTVSGMQYAAAAAEVLGGQTRIVLVTDGMYDPGPGGLKASSALPEGLHFDAVLLGGVKSPLPSGANPFESIWRYSQEGGLTREQ